MQDLLTMKREIIERHEDKLIAANQKIVDGIRDAIRDHKVSAKIGVGIIGKLTASTSFGRSLSAEMTSSDRLELTRALLANSANIMAELKGSHESLLKSVDDQLKHYQEEINSVDLELKDVEDKYNRAKLEEKRKGLVQKY